MEEASQVELSSTGSELDSKDEIKLQPSVKEISNNGESISFESFGPSPNGHILSVLEAFDRDNKSDTSSGGEQWNNSSVPCLEDFIFGLADPDRSYQNPFQLTDDV